MLAPTLQANRRPPRRGGRGGGPPRRASLCSAGMQTPHLLADDARSMPTSVQIGAALQVYGSASVAAARKMGVTSCGLVGWGDGLWGTAAYRWWKPSPAPLPCTGSLRPGATASITSSATRLEEAGFCPVISLPEATAGGGWGGVEGWRGAGEMWWAGAVLPQSLQEVDQAARPASQQLHTLMQAAVHQHKTIFNSSTPTCQRVPVGAHHIVAPQLLQLVLAGVGWGGEGAARTMVAASASGVPSFADRGVGVVSTTAAACSFLSRLPLLPALPRLPPAGREPPWSCPPPPPRGC